MFFDDGLRVEVVNNLHSQEKLGSFCPVQMRPVPVAYVNLPGKDFAKHIAEALLQPLYSFLILITLHLCSNIAQRSWERSLMQNHKLVKPLLLLPYHQAGCHTM